LPRKKKAVFIDGDFWHGREYERVLRNRPADDYWVKKIAYNMARDEAQMRELEDAGWSVLRVWDSDIKRKSTRNELIEQIVAFLAN
jgi:DNA mismatch endonuclease, patch repair protein